MYLTTDSQTPKTPNYIDGLKHTSFKYPTFLNWKAFDRAGKC